MWLKSCDQCGRISCRDRRPGHAKRGKRPVAAEPCAGAVGRHNSEMISGVWTQPADVGSDVPIGVPSLSLHWGGGSVGGRCSILE